MVAYCLIIDAPDVSGPKGAQERKKDKHSGSKSEVSVIWVMAAPKGFQLRNKFKN